MLLMLVNYNNDNGGYRNQEDRNDAWCNSFCYEIYLTNLDRCNYYLYSSLKKTMEGSSDLNGCDFVWTIYRTHNYP